MADAFRTRPHNRPCWKATSGPARVVARATTSGRPTRRGLPACKAAIGGNAHEDFSAYRRAEPPPPKAVANPDLLRKSRPLPAVGCRVGTGVTPGAPHRSVREEFPHTVRQHSLEASDPSRSQLGRMTRCCPQSKRVNDPRFRQRAQDLPPHHPLLPIQLVLGASST